MRSNSVRVSDRRSTLPSNASHSTAAGNSKLVGPGMTTSGAVAVGPPQVIDKWHFKHLVMSDPGTPGEEANNKDKHKVPLLYQKMQHVIQDMLNSEKGVPIRSHRNRLLSAVPSVFTGSDMIHWIMKRFSCSKVESMHLANMLYNHGYFYSVERLEPAVRDDGELFRFQTPHLWPSQNYDDSDFEYAVYLVKQLQRSKNRLRLADYELDNLRSLKKKLLLKWDYVNDRASDEARILKEQKKVARNLMENQERAFWRLRRPAPNDRKIKDCLLSRFGMPRKGSMSQPLLPLDVSLKREIAVLKEMKDMKRFKLSTTLEGLVGHCKKYAEFDPMLHTPQPSNPWITGDDTLWIIDKSLVEFPTEKQLKLWACSLRDQLNDVTGRYKFEQFCKKQYSSENIKFWQACNDLKLLPLISIPGSVKLVYDEFIDPSAPHMVNLSAIAFEEAKKDLENPTRYAFAAAEEQIYNLMQNDIYPRFLKTDYDILLKTSHGGGSFGKSFFKKFIPRTAGKTSGEKTIPITIISPCHPQRFTKRQLSISRSSGTNSQSMDNLFAANWDNSEHNLGLVDALTSPSSELNLGLYSNNNAMTDDKQRRVSAPSGPAYTSPVPPPSLENSVSPTLWRVEEDEEVGGRHETHELKENERIKLLKGGIRTSLIQSHSMDDFKRMESNEDDENEIKLKPVDFATQLMSLRTPNDMFDADPLLLDRKKSISIEDLHHFNTPFSPMESMTNFSPPHYSNNIRKSSKAAVAKETMVTITVPSPDYNFYSSNDSIHSAISN